MKIQTVAAAAAGTLLLSLGAFATATPASAAGDYSCGNAEDGAYSHPRRVDAYVQCVNHLAYVFDCHPSGLFYNPYPRPWGKCDWPENVDVYAPVYP
ncbi:MULTISPECIES: chitin binding peritrophin-A domain-containing protein [unclassified Streptomyces]|uniref:chitin binding peritrophin-A domain-containing protein n=1 Tax=unclassified Streptomyces TaxID=2593676 RepID=UPI00278C4DFE|nr:MULTISPECIES: chitin binding peritrophin-A domain-containing protein [unclassified Streptomyces]